MIRPFLKSFLFVYCHMPTKLNLGCMTEPALASCTRLCNQLPWLCSRPIALCLVHHLGCSHALVTSMACPKPHALDLAPCTWPSVYSHEHPSSWLAQANPLPCAPALGFLTALNSIQAHGLPKPINILRTRPWPSDCSIAARLMAYPSQSIALCTRTWPSDCSQ